MSSEQKLKQKLYELSFTEIEEPTRVNWLLGGHTSASVILASGYYDADDKAIRGRDSSGAIHYIPRRNIQSIG
jgi:hypothetical protein